MARAARPSAGRARLAAVAGALSAALGLAPAAQAPSPGRIDVLKAIGGLSPDAVGQFREPIGFEQHPNGLYVVFDRRGHAVFTVDPATQSTFKLIEIGGEQGRIIEPGAFDVARDGTIVVADAPGGRERIQQFDILGRWTSGFRLPGRAAPRITVEGLALSGVGTMAAIDGGVALNLPETGALVTEYSIEGVPLRSIGRLRATGHEADRDLHLAFNAAMPLPHPKGGYVVVFLAGPPAFRRYDARGELLYERVIQGRELDPLLAALPTRWPRRDVNGMELPLVVPTVRTAALDPAGRLWVSFTIPFTYVFDDEGEKIRTVQFRAAGLVSPTSVSFARDGRILVTPGCYAFRAP
ncbi:MAG: hypothetical protein AB1635_15100 [Acidobacteriota bacterium]